jgi:hypothetical protein
MTPSSIIMGLLIGAPTAPQTAAPPLMEALQEVEINQADDGGAGYQQGFRITFGIQRSPAIRPDYALLQSPLLQPGNRVVVTVTIAARPRVLVDGIITRQQLAFASAADESRLTIMGKDLSVLMDLVEKAIGHQGMQHEQVVNFILKDYAEYGIQPKVVAPVSSWPSQPANHIPFQSGTDRDYLQLLAAAYGSIFFIRPGPQPLKNTAYWGPPDFQAEPQKALTINVGADSNVETISFDYDALAPFQVYRAVAQDGGAEPTLVDTLKSTQSKALAKQNALTASDPLTRKLWLRYSGPDTGEPGARAQALVDRSIRMAVTGRGTLDTLRYGDTLLAPGMIGVRGVGTSYDGNYYLKAVKHRIRKGEYKQDFTITREGSGSLTQQVQV